jgi:hypothetical protein
VSLFNELWRLGHEVWVYTTSFRKPVATKLLFLGYGTRVARVINGDVHRKQIARLGDAYIQLLRRRKLVVVQEPTETNSLYALWTTTC